MKIYKWEWHVVFSGSEERNVAQGVGEWSQRVHLTDTTTPLYLHGKKFHVYKIKTLLLRSWFHLEQRHRCSYLLVFLSMRDGFNAFQTYSHFSLVLSLKMLGGNFFKWLFCNRLPKVIERGFNYVLLINMVRAPCMLENDVYFRVIIC